jgi:hypothetical protein
MQRLSYLPLFALTLLLLACDGLEISLPKSSFDTSFPKRNQRLTEVLGERLVIKTGGDTIALRILSTQKANLITQEESGDTLFYGTVSQFRGLYYFSQALNDTTYWIYAVKIANNLIVGLNQGLTQAYLIDQAIGKGEYPELLRYQDAEQIRLHPHKRETRQLFTQILAQLPADTILSALPLFSPVALANSTESDVPKEAELQVQVYPNPTQDFCTVRLAADGDRTYTLTDLKGKAVLQGVLNTRNNRLDLSQLTKGLYVLTLSGQEDVERQVVKLIKN